MFQSESPGSGDELRVWGVFGDLMACLFGLFVLFFVWLVAFGASLEQDLLSERARAAQVTSRLQALERALAGPLESGLITLVKGRIGIRGSVLFDLNSAQLTDQGERLLKALAVPLDSYLERRDESLMVSGFTDDLPMHGVLRTYRDNWELSAQRALTVSRALIVAGLPAGRLFAAGFGQNHPVAPNDGPENRARNRRVEMTPVASPSRPGAGLSSAGGSVVPGAAARRGSRVVLPPTSGSGAPGASASVSVLSSGVVAP